MKEVKSPKKPLIFYYGIALLVIVLFNVIVSPLLVKARVTEVDYGTFMSMIEQKKIGNVEVDDDQIIFTDKDDAKKIYKTGAMNDPTLTQRLYDSGDIRTDHRYDGFTIWAERNYVPCVKSFISLHNYQLHDFMSIPRIF